MELECESLESRKRARIKMGELSHILSVSMSLKAVVKLNIADAIWQNGANTPLLASEILSNIGKGGDPETLQRVLRILTSHGVFKEHLAANENGDLQRRFSLTDVGQTLVPDSDGLSYGSYVLQHHQDELVKAWSLVDEVVMDSTIQPFEKVHGESTYEYYGKHPEMNELMQKAMSGTSLPMMKAVLSSYHGFQGVKTLVDVGGSQGVCTKMIVQKYPHIHGINFDLPPVIAKALPIAGVTHVGGDMLKSIPSGDAIFIKLVMAAHSDEECKLIMENSYKALPNGGKLIICDCIMPKETDESVRTRALLGSDIFLMTVHNTKGKVRAEEEFKNLAHSAGFTYLKSLEIDYLITIMEFLK